MIQIDERGSQDSEQSAADVGTDDQKLDEFDKMPANHITALAGSTNSPLTFRCENKQVCGICTVNIILRSVSAVATRVCKSTVGLRAKTTSGV